MRNTLLVLHLIGVATWLGGNVVLAFAGPRNLGAAVEARLWWARTQGAMARVMYNVAGVLVLVTGVGMVLESEVIGFSTPFVGIGILAVIIGAVLGMAVFGPGTRRLADAIDAGDPAEEQAANNRLTTFGLIDTLVVVFTMAAMVAAWGLG